MENIKFLGQCGFWIKENNRSILIDPVLTELCEDGKSLMHYKPVMNPEDIEPDLVFCSHDHIDHLETETVKRIAKHSLKTTFVVPEGCEGILNEAGITKDRYVLMADKSEKIFFDGEIIVKSFSTAHPVHHLDDEGKDRNLGYCLDFGDKKYVHVGDTYRTDRLFESMQALGKIDLLFVPINGRDEEREARGIVGNLNAKQAARLASDLDVKYVIPMHFDMMIGNTADPQDFVKAMKEMDSQIPYEIPVLYKAK